MPSPRTATPRRRARYRSPRRTACASGAAGTATRCGSRPEDRQEVERLGEIAVAETEVADRDRGREPVIEALRYADFRVDRVPAGANRQLVHAQLARVEQPVQLDAAEDARAEIAELGSPVLTQVPRVAGSFSPLRRERQHVRRRDVRH